MKAITLQSQQVSYSLSVTTIRQDNDNVHMFIIPLMSLTWLVMLFWQSQLIIGQSVFSFLTLKEIAISRIDLYCKLLAIGFNSVLWGLT